METLNITPAEGEQGKRLDVWLSHKLAQYSRSYLDKLIKDGKVTVNNKAAKGSYKVKDIDIVTVELPDIMPSDVLPEQISLNIIFEDTDIVIINKPRGMVVHPGAGNYSGTLVNALLYYYGGNLSTVNGVTRPGIVHRIDKDTSGLLIIAKNDIAHKALSEQISKRSVVKKYIAIVIGTIKEDSAKIHIPIGRNRTKRVKMAVDATKGKEAVTHFCVLERFKGYTYIEASIETGRTHQIRVHMSHIGFPLLGDTVYGPKTQNFGVKGQCLHASMLGFTHPTTGEYMEIKAPIPEYFEKLLDRLRVL